MISFRVRVFFALLFVSSMLSAGSVQQSSTCVTLPKQIEAALLKHTTSMRAAEYCEIRKVARGDVNGDGREDFAIAYSLEGPCNTREGRKSSPGTCGNVALQFFAMFIATPSGFRMLGPNPLEPAVERATITGSAVILDTLDWTPTDPHCCPSRKGTTTFEIVNGKLQRSPR
jgi:hypothetical protein